MLEPLADQSIKYFALDNVAYHGHNLTVAYDSAGAHGRYAGKGCTGFCVWVDGKLAHSSPTLARLNVSLVAGSSNFI